MQSTELSDFVVAIGASAGGLRAIRELIEELPPDLDAPIVVAVHGNATSQLTEVLSELSSLKIKKIEDGEALAKGWIYIVPGAKHAFFGNGRIRLSDVVRDSGFRPSIDALFMTLTAEYGPRSIAVVLSGTMKDGMRGAQVVYDMGGRTIVQDPEDAKYAEMPKSVILRDHPETVRSASELGVWLGKMIGNIG